LFEYLDVPVFVLNVIVCEKESTNKPPRHISKAGTTIEFDAVAEGDAEGDGDGQTTSDRQSPVTYLPRNEQKVQAVGK
jgi:hypothetical protein